MKRKLALTISLAMIVALASLMRSDSTASAQQRRVFRGDTGVVPLGSHQVLRITVDWGDGDPGTVRFGRIAYMPEGLQQRWGVQTCRRRARHVRTDNPDAR